MVLFLTGASSSVTTSAIRQDDPQRSLGGYISGSPVPNGAINSLFDLISMKTLKDKMKETIAIGLVNEFNYPVTDISAKILTDKGNICNFKIAAVTVNDELCMEHINNRYDEPTNVEFHDATFYRASVDVEILRCGIIGEEISFDPFDIIVTITEPGIEGTYQSIKKTFSKSEIYRTIRLSENAFRIERNDDTALDEPLSCSFLSTDNADFKFLGDFGNKKNNEILISDFLDSNQAIGLWLQREISESVEKGNEELIKDYDEKRKEETIEEVELIINYNILDETSNL